MKNPRALLLGLLLLAACGNQPAPLPTSPRPPETQRPPSPVRSLQSFGMYELKVTGASTATPSAEITPSGLRAQASDISGLQFAPLSFGTYTDELTRTRYLRASFKVTNATGQALSVPTYVPVDTDGQDATVGTTPFKRVLYFDGSDAGARASDLQLGTAHRLNSATGGHEIDPGATPFVENLDTRSLNVGVPAGTTVARVFREGWQGGALAPGAEQVVTFATRLPMGASAKQDPFSFSLVFAVTDNPGPLPSDVTAPTVALTLSPETLTTAGAVKFSADAQDAGGVREVRFYDGAALLGTDTTAPYEWTKTYGEADNGERLIRAVAADMSGNEAEAGKTLKVSVQAPVGQLTSLSADLIRSNRSEGVAGSGVQLYRSGDRSAAVAQGQTDARGYVEFTSIPEGVYDLVFSKAGSAGSEFIGAVARAGINHRLKIAQFDAQNPTADKAVPRLALLAPTAKNTDGSAADWKTLTPGTVMNGLVTLRAYTTADNPNPLQLKYLMFSLVSFDATGQMTELRNALSSIDPGVVTPGINSQDSGQMDLDPAGLSGDIYVQVSSLDFNNNRSAYLVPVRVEGGPAAGAVSAPTGVSAVAYTNTERVNYIYSAPGEELNAAEPIAPDSNSWVSVSWDAPASLQGLSGFRVLRATEAQGIYTEVAFAGAKQCSTTTKRCTVSDNTATLRVGQDYYYRVKAIGSGEAVSAVPTLPSTQVLPPFKPQLIGPGAEQTDVDLLPVFSFKTNAFAGGATGLRFDLRVSDAFTSVGNMDAPALRLINQGGSLKVTGAGTDTRDYGKWVTYDAATDTLNVPHDLTRVRSGLSATPLQANRRYSWMLHRAYTYRLLDPAQPESATNPVVAYSAYSDPDTTKVVPGGATQSPSTVHHFITRP